MGAAMPTIPEGGFTHGNGVHEFTQVCCMQNTSDDGLMSGSMRFAREASETYLFACVSESHSECASCLRECSR